MTVELLVEPYQQILEDLPGYLRITYRNALERAKASVRYLIDMEES